MIATFLDRQRGKDIAQRSHLLCLKSLKVGPSRCRTVKQGQYHDISKLLPWWRSLLIRMLLNFIKVRSSSAILTPSLILAQKSSPTQIIQRPAHRSAGELQLPRYSLDRWPASAFLIGTILEVHIHSNGPVRQISSID